MRPGDLVRYSGLIGIVLRPVVEEDIAWGMQTEGEPAYWIQWASDMKDLWAYEKDLRILSKGN